MLAPMRFVALGDSYTIGTAVAPAEAWPEQLVRALAEAGSGAGDSMAGLLELVANLAVNGYTSRDVIEFELPALERLRPEFVSILIGVNDVVQGVPEERYHRNVEAILDELVGQVGAAYVIAVTTPDYTVTPAGADYGDPRRQAAGIARYNAIFSELATARRVAVVDIHDISLRAAADRTLVAADGLHPSGSQYGLWVERIAPVVRRLAGS
jgi:acyl-CoA thioesterase-1